MIPRLALAALVSALCLAAPSTAQEADSAPAMTIGNGEMNAIEVDGLTRQDGVTTFTEVHVDGELISNFRGHSTAITFPEVLIEAPGWLVLHPVIDGRPNGDMVSGFTYVSAGQTADVTVQIDHPADAGDRFLVMLHSDTDGDRVFDFVFVEDGINVEDRAVFEGNQMIAHLIELP